MLGSISSAEVGVLIGAAVVCLGLLVIYYYLLARAILEMLRCEAKPVMLFFAFFALIPLPPTVVMGVLVLIIWHLYKKSLPAPS